VQSRQRRQFRVYVRRSPSRKFETLFIACERNIADARRCQSHRKKVRVQIVQAVHSLRSFRPLVRQNSAPLSFESRRLSSLLMAISFCSTRGPSSRGIRRQSNEWRFSSIPGWFYRYARRMFEEYLFLCFTVLAVPARGRLEQKLFKAVLPRQKKATG
jgi:hypothetical protein